MTGVGTAHGAATVVNAIACGKGAAFGIDLRTEARVDLKGDDIVVRIDGHADEPDALVALCVRKVLRAHGHEGGAVVSTASTIPISRGLKSSSAAANAALAAALDALGESMEPLDMVRLGCACAVEAGVSITGAFDDACASFLGGLVLTDNRANVIEARMPMPGELKVLVHVPPRRIRKSEVPVGRVRLLRAEAELAYGLALRGEWRRAMVLNGVLQGAALGLGSDEALRALELGAVSAGVSGTGPAVVAVAGEAAARDIAEAWGKGCLVAGIFNGEE
jgi:shikimate kinase